MQNYRKELCQKADEYCAVTGNSRGYLASMIVNDARFFDRIESGGGCTVDTYQKVMSWFEKNKPSAEITNSNHREELTLEKKILTVSTPPQKITSTKKLIHN